MQDAALQKALFVLPQLYPRGVDFLVNHALCWQVCGQRQLAGGSGHRLGAAGDVDQPLAVRVQLKPFEQTRAHAIGPGGAGGEEELAAVLAALLQPLLQYPAQTPCGCARAAIILGAVNVDGAQRRAKAVGHMEQKLQGWKQLLAGQHDHPHGQRG